MSDQPDSQQPPMFFANIVTTNLYPDELVMELRRYIQEHKAQKPDAVEIPPPTPQEIYQTQPIARVVLTFTAARGLKDYLDKVIPLMEQRRKAL